MLTAPAIRTQIGYASPGGKRAYGASYSSNDQALLRTRQLRDTAAQLRDRIASGKTVIPDEDQKADDDQALSLLESALEELVNSIDELKDLKGDRRSEALRRVDRARKDILAVTRECAPRVAAAEHQAFVEEVEMFCHLNETELVTPRNLNVAWRSKAPVPVSYRQQRRDQEKKRTPRPGDSLVASIAGLSAIAEGREAEPASSPTLGAGMGAQQQQQSPGEVQSAAPASALSERVPQLKLDAGLHAQYRDTSEEGDNIRRSLSHGMADSSTTMCNLDSCASPHKAHGTAGHPCAALGSDCEEEDEDEVSSASRDAELVLLPEGPMLLSTAGMQQRQQQQQAAPQRQGSLRAPLELPTAAAGHGEVQRGAAEAAAERISGEPAGAASQQRNSSGSGVGDSRERQRAEALRDATNRELAIHANRSYMGADRYKAPPAPRQRPSHPVLASASIAATAAAAAPADPPADPAVAASLPDRCRLTPTKLPPGSPRAQQQPPPNMQPQLVSAAAPLAPIGTSADAFRYNMGCAGSLPAGTAPSGPHLQYSSHAYPGGYPPLMAAPPPHAYGYPPHLYAGMPMGALPPHAAYPHPYAGIGYGSLPPSGPCSLRDFPVSGGPGAGHVLPPHRNIAGPGTDVNVPVANRRSNQSYEPIEWDNASLTEVEPVQGRRRRGRRGGGGLFGVMRSVVGFVGVSMLSGAAMVLGAAAVNTSLDEQAAQQQAKSRAAAGARGKRSQGPKRLGRGSDDLIPQRTLQQLRSPDLVTLGRG